MSTLILACVAASAIATGNPESLRVFPLKTAEVRSMVSSVVDENDDEETAVAIRRECERLMREPVSLAWLSRVSR
jgi:hypothetical protein